MDLTMPSSVRTVCVPANRSEHHLGRESRGRHSEPGEPCGISDAISVRGPKNAQNRVEVSITPAQRWVKLTSSSCGKVVKK